MEKPCGLTGLNDTGPGPKDRDHRSAGVELDGKFWGLAVLIVDLQPGDCWSQI